MNTDQQILTEDLRNQLKSILEEELRQLPDTLQELEPKDRIHLLCKLMPFIIPKVDSISHSIGEPFTF